MTRLTTTTMRVLRVDDPTSYAGRWLGAVVGLLLPPVAGWVQFRLLGLSDPTVAAAASRRSSARATASTTTNNNLHQPRRDDENAAAASDARGTTTNTPPDVRGGAITRSTSMTTRSQSARRSSTSTPTSRSKQKDEARKHRAGGQQELEEEEGHETPTGVPQERDGARAGEDGRGHEVDRKNAAANLSNLDFANLSNLSNLASTLVCVAMLLAPLVAPLGLLGRIMLALGAFLLCAKTVEARTGFMVWRAFAASTSLLFIYYILNQNAWARCC